MREVISNTSPLQYLFQAELLDLLPTLYGTVVVPGGVVDELAEGRARGVALPEPTLLSWVHVRLVPDTALLRMAADLDRGEREVLALSTQIAEPLAILPIEALSSVTPPELRSGKFAFRIGSSPR